MKNFETKIILPRISFKGTCAFLRILESLRHELNRGIHAGFRFGEAARLERAGVRHPSTRTNKQLINDEPLGPLRTAPAPWVRTAHLPVLSWRDKWFSRGSDSETHVRCARSRCIPVRFPGAGKRKHRRSAASLPHFPSPPK